MFLVIGFIFGKWLGTAILVLGNTFGSALLYILANTFFSEFIQKKFSTKFSKHVELFNRNELLYFMFFIRYNYINYKTYYCNIY